MINQKKMLNPNETCNLISFVYSQFSFSLFVLPFSKFYERLTFSLHVLHSSCCSYLTCYNFSREIGAGWLISILMRMPFD